MNNFQNAKVTEIFENFKPAAKRFYYFFTLNYI